MYVRPKNREADCTGIKYRLAGFWLSIFTNLLFLIPAAAGYGNEIFHLSVPDAVPWIVNIVFLLAPSFFLNSEFFGGYLLSLAVIALASILYEVTYLATCVLTGNANLFSGSDDLDSYMSCILPTYIIAWLFLAAWQSERAYDRNCRKQRPAKKRNEPDGGSWMI